MRRRHFLHHASLLAAAAAIAPYQACATGMPIPFGYQLFSVRDAMAKDALGTIKALLSMGYAHFEAYGYDATVDTLYGLSPKLLKRELDALGTRLPSAHFGFADYVNVPVDELRRYTDQCLTCAEALDMRYLVWPILRDSDRTIDGFKRVAERLSIIAEQLSGSGRDIVFHNNGGEFLKLADGRRGYDIILAEAAPSVLLELDMYWLAHDEAAETPAQLIAQDPERFVMWHVKDMHPTSRDYTELGAGTIPYPKHLPDINAAGLQYLFLEQGGNFTDSSMKSAAVNAGHWQDALATHVC